MTNKRGRKPFPQEMKANTTSIRLTDKQLNTFKTIGGNQWLKLYLDHMTAMGNKYVSMDAKELAEAMQEA